MSFNDFFRRFLIVLLVLLLLAGIWAARATLMLGFAAAIVAVGISIPAGWLQRRGMRRGWALALAIAGFILLLLALLLWLLPSLVREFVALLETFPNAIGALSTLYRDLRESSTLLKAALPAAPNLAATAIDPATAGSLLGQFVNAGLAIGPQLWAGIGNAVSILVNVALILSIGILLAIDPFSYTKSSLYLMPQRYHARAIEIWNQLYDTVRIWLSTLLLSITITMALVWLILGVLLGMPNAMIVAVFAGVATFVPNIGAALPLIPIAIITLATDPSQFLILAPAYLLIQMLESSVITPSLIKAELNIPAGGIMLFQLLMTLAFGALGLLLAVPMLAVLIVLVREIFSYDLLGLRSLHTEITTDAHGHLALQENKLETTSRVIAPPTEVPAVAKSGLV
jgi:predicted PurR-regulated permease PerM